MFDKPLTYTVTDGSHEGVVLIKLVGPATLQNLFTMQDELRTIHPPLTIFDLAECEYMDSSGLGILMNFYVSAEKAGHRMALASVNQRIEALLDLAKVKTILRVFPTVAEAETSA